MYQNLETEIARAGIKKKHLAKEIDCNPGTLSMKLSGKNQFTLEEAVKIKKALNTDAPIEYLFATDSQ